MSANDIDEKWAQANRISDRIIDIIDDERTKPGFNPLQMMAGQMMALVGFLRTSPEFKPQQVADAQTATEECLRAMYEASKRGDL